MTKTLSDDIKEAIKPDDDKPEAKANDPMRAGLDHLRAADPDLMAAWTVKGPRGDGSEISMVYLDSGAQRLVFQRASGKFKIFAPID